MSFYIVLCSGIHSSKQVYVRKCNGTSQHGAKKMRSMCGTVKKWHSSYRVILGIYCVFFHPPHETRYMLEMYLHFFIPSFDLCFTTSGFRPRLPAAVSSSTGSCRKVPTSCRSLGRSIEHPLYWQGARITGKDVRWGMVRGKKPWEELESARCMERHRPRFTKHIWNQLLNISPLSMQILPFNPTCTPILKAFRKLLCHVISFHTSITEDPQTQTGLLPWADKGFGELRRPRSQVQIHRHYLQDRLVGFHYFEIFEI